MKHTLADLTEIMMNEEEASFVSLPKLFSLMRLEKPELDTSFESYIDSIRHDERFEVHDGGFDTITDALRQEFEERGIFGGPYVTFNGMELSQVEYIDLLNDRLSHMIMQLEQLYHARLLEFGADDDRTLAVSSIIQRAGSLKNKLEIIY
jgi:hypothetical protein